MFQGGAPYGLDEDDDELGNSHVTTRNSFKSSGEMPVSGSKGKYGQLADRVLFSTAYFIAYIFIILSNFVLIIWLLVMLARKKFETRGHWLFVTLDVIVNLAFVSEISLYILSQKKAYFSKWSNIFDFAVMMLSVISLGIYFSRDGVVEQVEDLLALGLLGIRYVLQFLRLIAMLRRHKVLHSTRKGVDFSQLNAEEFQFIHSDQNEKL